MLLLVKEVDLHFVICHALSSAFLLHNLGTLSDDLLLLLTDQLLRIGRCSLEERVIAAAFLVKEVCLREGSPSTKCVPQLFLPQLLSLALLLLLFGQLGTVVRGVRRCLLVVSLLLLLSV